MRSLDSKHDFNHSNTHMYVLVLYLLFSQDYGLYKKQPVIFTACEINP